MTLKLFEVRGVCPSLSWLGTWIVISDLRTVTGVLSSNNTEELVHALAGEYGVKGVIELEEEASDSGECL